jgi:hypothetical protein
MSMYKLNVCDFYPDVTNYDTFLGSILHYRKINMLHPKKYCEDQLRSAKPAPFSRTKFRKGTCMIQFMLLVSKKNILPVEELHSVVA